MDNFVIKVKPKKICKVNKLKHYKFCLKNIAQFAYFAHNSGFLAHDSPKKIAHKNKQTNKQTKKSHNSGSPGYGVHIREFRK